MQASLDKNAKQPEVICRSVPITNQIRLLFGGIIFHLFGWIWFGFSMICFWLGAWNSELFFPSLLHFTPNVSSTTGQLLTVTKTGQYEGGSDTARGNPIFAYHYVFKVDAKKYTCVSYDFKREVNHDSLNVEFVDFYPESSRIAEMRVRPVPIWAALIMLLFIGIGLLFIIVKFKGGLKEIRLLRTGLIATATLVYKREYSDDGSTYYDLTYQFTTLTGESICTKLNAPFLKSREEPILYFPYHPFKNKLISEMELPMKLDSDGNIEAVGLFSAFWAAFIPALVVLENLAFLIRNLFFLS